jgi:hypothetical protein
MIRADISTSQSIGSSSALFRFPKSLHQASSNNATSGTPLLIHNQSWERLVLAQDAFQRFGYAVHLG